MSTHLLHIGKNLKMIREYRKLSEIEVSNKTGITLIEIINIEKGIHNPDINTLVKIASALNAYIDINFTPVK